ncbi:Dipeptide transport system permease protein DppB [Pseudonocardia sp. Ae406_Ps2]|uniref:ABC transporter permease n=1 Tax=unclassified Pseudonocardia TaxID=2619320 RepID=UPI00094B07B2|nr:MULTISPECIES: ABC transporter permease [unclassified Pseudonocardia]OLM00574.1 Dipeptide transport system permease protein DppB [Pseudonocardia sp. Ae406_Ps2]OLM07635.1 Dipeptide transport system permease protein DppB [Pseudonocardia sp. Ae331_Ps2]OLM22147.1 Dipeptide transport system permease protein DppB [Pseudonocardia sp. Ae706_Ps2]OLM31221.1 Dipeptide transport system permease protein DppB [Pseudonocardia sp. Ae717_Ps2]
MTRYVLGRLGQALLVVWAAYTITFAVLYVLPGDPVTLMAGTGVGFLTPAQLDGLRHEYGFDRPLVVQYATRLGAAAVGDWGHSIVSNRPVLDVVGEALLSTLQLTAAGLTVAVVGGTVLALVTVGTGRRWLAQLLGVLPPLGVAVPAFWFGLLLIQWFAFGIPLFPAFGAQGPASLVLPAVALAVPTGATIAQLLTRSLDATLAEPYIHTIRARGAGTGRVLLRHALRNAALPTVTMTGLIVGGLLSGAVVVETVFSRPGLGRVVAQAVEQQDVAVVQGVVVLAAIVFVLTGLVVDLLYPVLDPRIRVAGRRPARSVPGGAA